MNNDEMHDLIVNSIIFYHMIIKELTFYQFTKRKKNNRNRRNSKRIKK